MCPPPQIGEEVNSPTPGCANANGIVSKANRSFRILMRAMQTGMRLGTLKCVPIRGVTFGHFSDHIQSEVQCLPVILSKHCLKLFAVQTLSKYMPLYE